MIKTGGKQYLVAVGDKIKVEKIAGEEGQKTAFNQVLLLEKNDKVEVGSPFIKGAEVVAKIIKQAKGKKVIIFKYKAKKRERTKKGHRQPFTEIEITEIK